MPWGADASCGAMALRALGVDLSEPFGETTAAAEPDYEKPKVIVKEGWDS